MGCVEWVVLSGLCEFLVRPLLRRDDKIVGDCGECGCGEWIV